jgi:hypothetical protein
VDKKIGLPNADKDVMFRLFCMVFKRLEGAIVDPEQPAEDDETVERYAGEFAREIPEGEFSPAEIQQRLGPCGGGEGAGMDGEDQGGKVENGEGGFFRCGFALAYVTRSGVGRENCSGISDCNLLFGGFEGR